MIDASSFGDITGQIDYGGSMPVNQKIMRSMRKTYGSEKKAKQVYFASVNKGTIHESKDEVPEGIASTLRLKEEQRRKLPRIT